jgi:hypothetical protein
MPSFGFTPSGSPLGRGRHRKAALRAQSARPRSKSRRSFGHKPAGPTNAPNQSVPDKYDLYEKTFRTSGGQ